MDKQHLLTLTISVHCHIGGDNQCDKRFLEFSNKNGIWYEKLFRENTVYVENSNEHTNYKK